MTHLLGQPLEYRDLRRTSMLKESGIPTRSAAFLRLKQRLCSMRRHRSKESQAFLLLKQRLSSTRRYPGGDALEHLRRDGVLHPLEAAVGYVFPYGF